MESLPSTPETQLDCGLEIMKSAFAQRVHELEEENVDVRKFGKEKMQQVQTLEQKVSSVEKLINELTVRARELGNENHALMTERDHLQEKAATVAAHVKALQAFKKNCQSFLDCRDDLPDIPITPEPPSGSPSGSQRASRRPSNASLHSAVAGSREGSRSGAGSVRSHQSKRGGEGSRGSHSARNSQPASQPGSNWVDGEDDE